MCDDKPAVSRRTALRSGAAMALAASPFLAAAPALAAPRRASFKVLVFSRTTGFRHLSIPDGIRAIGELGQEHGFAVDATEDPTWFTRDRLDQYAAVIFLSTTGTVLDTPGQRRAFERYISSGGGYVGIHSAADTEYDWPFYGELVGAYFLCHPLQQLAFFDNDAPDHPATAHLDQRFPAFDEFYSFASNPRPDVRVLLTIDEATYQPNPNTSNIPLGADGTYNPDWYPGEDGYMGDHPMSWTHDKFRGRAFYTALGHESYLYGQDWYRRHLLGGILTAARQDR